MAILLAVIGFLLAGGGAAAFANESPLGGLGLFILAAISIIGGVFVWYIGAKERW